MKVKEALQNMFIRLFNKFLYFFDKLPISIKKSVKIDSEGFFEKMYKVLKIFHLVEYQI